MSIKIAIVQMDIAFGDPETNRKQAQIHIEKAAQHGSEVILLPELWTTGYDLSRFGEVAETMEGPTHKMLKDLAIKHQVTLTGSIAEQDGQQFFNTFVSYSPTGDRLIKYRKAHLFRLMNEEKHLHSGHLKGTFTLMDIPVAGVICYDIRFPEWIRTHMMDGSQALFVVAEWPEPRIDHWRSLLVSRAIENQCFIIASNRVGSDPNNKFGGHSIVINPWGEIVAEAGNQEEILYAEVEFSDVESIREQIPIFQDRRPDLYE